MGNIESDPRLEDPDQYFEARYGHVGVRYGEHVLPLSCALAFERLARGSLSSEEILERDGAATRANKFIELLRAVDALRPEDDIAPFAESE